MIKTTYKKIFNSLFELKFVLSIVFGISKSYFLYILITAFLSATLTFITSYNITVILYAINFESFKYATICVGVFIILKLILSILVQSSKKKEQECRYIIIQEMSEKIFIHLSKIPYSYLEDSNFLDLVSKMKEAVNNEECIELLLKSTLELIEKIILVIILYMALISINMHISVIVITILVCSLMAIFKMKNEVAYYNENIVINRRFLYYAFTLVDYNYAKDFRIFKIGKLMLEKFHRFSESFISVCHYFEKKRYKLDSCQNIFIVILKILSIYLVYINYSEFQDLSSVSYAIETIISFFINTTLVFSSFKSLIFGLKLCEFLIKFFEIKTDTSYGTISYKEKEHFLIEFKNVYFKYPGSDRNVLNDVSFVIRKNDRICLVGENGAGKSTIIKLLCRLYRPTSGQILLNGISIYDYDNSYTNCISTMFQDTLAYTMQIKDYLLDENKENRFALYEKVGLKNKIDSLHLKEETFINPIFNEGINLSGGEFQKLNLARALSKKGIFMLLDEPTSSIDAKGEEEIFKAIDTLPLDTTIIFVTHRMSSAKSGNRIIELANGRIKNDSCMNELLNKEDSLFRKLFLEQKNKYQY